MTTTLAKPKPKRSFQLPTRKAQRIRGQINGRMSAIFLSMASDKRIREATPSMKSLYTFLGKPLP